ncbi:HlyD family efflux transporter periplasmic adaptor subunit [Sulfitobacter sp.]|uniref:HlyD family efflux transporter periplasmic adaptor subunit n=1 Tax=Sulfitobacter sp. TaxID=1903071 RepID=UPI0030039CEB
MNRHPSDGSSASELSGKSDATGGHDDDKVSIMDNALWSRFSDDLDLDDFARLWLALTVRMLGPCEGGAVVLEMPNGLVPVALWPQGVSPGHAMMAAVETSLHEERGVVQSGRCFSQPLMVDGEPLGSICLEFQSPPDDAAEMLHKMRWASGWLIAALRRDLSLAEHRDRAKVSLVLDTIGAVLEANSSRSAMLAACNLLARELDCAHVGIGRASPRRRMKVTALSDVSDQPRETTHAQAIALAMSEAFYQEGSVLYPPRDSHDFMVAQHHASLLRESGAGELLSVALFSSSGGPAIGALHLAKRANETFSEEELMVAEGVGAALGALIDEREQGERGVLRVFLQDSRQALGRLLGPGYLGRKLAVLVLAGMVAFFWFAKADFRVVAQSEIQGEIVRTMVAPFDGHIAEQFARAGDVVKQDMPLLGLDERDLQIELTRWLTDVGRYQGEYDQALAGRVAATARIASANIEQARAKADLTQRQLDRAVLRAPFDAVVIEGDHSQSLGAAVRLGQQLFRLAPLDSYRVALEVEERDLDQVRIGQTGTLVLAPLPDRQFAFKLTQITPRMNAEGGRNYAIVEAQLTENSADLRPGMRGIGKVQIEERLLIDVWTRPIIDWARLALWRWTG